MTAPALPADGPAAGPFAIDPAHPVVEQAPSCGIGRSGRVETGPAPRRGSEGRRRFADDGRMMETHAFFDTALAERALFDNPPRTARDAAERMPY